MSTIPTLENKSSPVNKTLRFQTKCLTGVSQSRFQHVWNQSEYLRPWKQAICVAPRTSSLERNFTFGTVCFSISWSCTSFSPAGVFSVFLQNVCVLNKSLGCLRQGNWSWTGHYLQQENWRKEKCTTRIRKSLISSFLNKQKKNIYIYNIIYLFIYLYIFSVCSKMTW